MSPNYRFYAEQMAARRARLGSSVELRRQLDELFEAVGRCEAIWALEVRIEKAR